MSPALESTPSPAKSRADAWAANCAELVRFWERTGTLPSGYRQGRERRLYVWLGYQRRRHQLGKLSQEKINALNAVDIWLTGAFLSRGEWQDKLDAFVAAHGRKPSLSTADRDERALARARPYYCLDIPEDSLNTGMRQIRDRESWDKNMAALRAWVGINNRLPKMRAPDPEESRLANFINYQRRSVAAGKVAADMEAHLRTIPGVLEARPKDRPAHEWTALVEAFIARTGRIPHLRAEDPEERSLASARYRHRIGMDDEICRAA